MRHFSHSSLFPQPLLTSRKVVSGLWALQGGITMQLGGDGMRPVKGWNCFSFLFWINFEARVEFIPYSLLIPAQWQVCLFLSTNPTALRISWSFGGLERARGMGKSTEKLLPGMVGCTPLCCVLRARLHWQFMFRQQVSKNGFSLSLPTFQKALVLL